MSVFGFSINVLTMFGMVLAIGILVDDAIVVVENVERIMVEEGLAPLAGDHQGDGADLRGAIVGITLVLSAVFIPMAFMAVARWGSSTASSRCRWRSSILFSAFLALTLTPALCATLLKPAIPRITARRGFFGWFNRGLAARRRMATKAGQLAWSNGVAAP
jgi:multidrug efflux pump subunit AcrB